MTRVMLGRVREVASNLHSAEKSNNAFLVWMNAKRPPCFLVQAGRRAKPQASILVNLEDVGNDLQ